MSLPGLVPDGDHPSSDIERAEQLANDIAGRLSYIDSQAYKGAMRLANGVRNRLKRINQHIAECVEAATPITSSQMGATTSLSGGSVTDVHLPLPPDMTQYTQPISDISSDIPVSQALPTRPAPSPVCPDPFGQPPYCPLGTHPAWDSVNCRWICVLDIPPPPTTPGEDKPEPVPPEPEPGPEPEPCPPGTVPGMRGTGVTCVPVPVPVPPGPPDDAEPCDEIPCDPATLVRCEDITIVPPYWTAIYCTGTTSARICCYQGCCPPELSPGVIVTGPYDTCPLAATAGTGIVQRRCGSTPSYPVPPPNTPCGPNYPIQPPCREGYHAVWNNDECVWTCEPDTPQCPQPHDPPSCPEGMVPVWDQVNCEWSCRPAPPSLLGPDIPLGCLECPTCIAS